MENIIYEIKNLTDNEKYVFLNLLKASEENKNFYDLFKKYFSKTKYNVNKTTFKSSSKETRIAIYKSFKLLKDLSNIEYEKIIGEFTYEKE